jgi:hypothetical protein
VRKALNNCLVGGAPGQVEGDAPLRVEFDGLPRGARTKTDFSGMFKQVDIDRARRWLRQIQAARGVL